MNGYGKRLLACCLCLVFAFLSLGAASQSMTLRTTVPGQVSVDVRLSGRGSLRIGDRALRESEVLQVAYSSTLEIQVTPDRGAAVKRILWNGADVTADLKNGVLTLTGLGTENTLQVTFRTARSGGENPATGDAPLLPAALLCLTAASSLLLLCRGRKKTRGKPRCEE